MNVNRMGSRVRGLAFIAECRIRNGELKKTKNFNPRSAIRNLKSLREARMFNRSLNISYFK